MRVHPRSYPPLPRSSGLRGRTRQPQVCGQRYDEDRSLRLSMPSTRNDYRQHDRASAPSGGYDPIVNRTRLVARCAVFFISACSASAPSALSEQQTGTDSNEADPSSTDAGEADDPMANQTSPGGAPVAPGEAASNTDTPPTIVTPNPVGPEMPTVSLPGEGAAPESADTDAGAGPPPVPTACQEGERTCTGPAELAECREGQFVYLATCATQCSVVQEVASCIGNCAPGSIACETEATPIACSPSGEWVAQESCGSDAPHCLDGRCEACRPNERECLDEGPAVCGERDGELQFIPQAACEGDTPVCVSGYCEQCTPLAERPCPGAAGTCAEGREVCGEGAVWGDCDVQPKLVDDCVAGRDANCDGELDCECIAGATRACGIEPSSFGCSSGEQTCEQTGDGNDTRWSECRFTPQTDETRCLNDDPLTINDRCVAGQCVGTRVGRLATGDFDTCAIRSEGRVYCWGLMTGDLNGSEFPIQSVPFEGPAESLSASGGSVCAVLRGGAAACTGGNYDGQLGNGTTESTETPVAVSSLGNTLMVSASYVRTAALTADGRVFLWGLYEGVTDDGQRELFGTSLPPLTDLTETVGSSVLTRFAVLTPSRVAGITNAKQIALGHWHACALEASGEVLCWGLNDAQQLGFALATALDEPNPVPGLGDAIYIDAGRLQTCAVLENGSVVCWGSQCSTGLRDCASVGSGPQRVAGISDAVQVAVQAAGACALRSNGEVACWGSNELGGLGNGGTANSSTPVAVAGLSDIVALGVPYESGHHFCAERKTGDIVCWGMGGFAQLGNESTELIQNAPVSVLNLPD